MIDDRKDLDFNTQEDINLSSDLDVEKIGEVSEESVDEVNEIYGIYAQTLKQSQEKQIIIQPSSAPSVSPPVTQLTSDQIIGKINVLKTLGSSDITTYRLKKTKKTRTYVVPQGTAEVSFTLSGDVLSLVPKYNFDINKKRPDTIGDLSSNFKQLGILIQEAYEETLIDANAGFKLTESSLDARNRLHYALKNILAFEGGSNNKVKLIFRSNDGRTKVIPFLGAAFFPVKETDEKYVRHIIDLDAMTISKNKNVGTAKITNAADIPIKMIVRSNKPGESPQLETNTDYKFVGVQDDTAFQVNIGMYTTTTTSSPMPTTGINQVDGIDPTFKKIYLSGFTMGDFKTAKASAKIEVTTDMFSSTIEQTSAVNVLFNGISTTAISNVISTDFYVSQIGDKNYVDMKLLTEKSNINSSGDFTKPDSESGFLVNKIEPTGTTIKFKPLVFTDKDKSIKKVQFENDRGQLFDAKLTPINSSKTDGPAYLEVTGLERGTPYIFKKFHITSNTHNKDFLNTIYFGNHTPTTSATIIDLKSCTVDPELNKLPIRTTQFYGPKLVLIGEANKETILIGDVKVIPVKNDRTALRYILKPDTTDGTLGDITVNGLRTGEEYKIDKVVDSAGEILYYILILYNLTPDTDYRFLILELSYTDPRGNSSVSRQALGSINNVTEIAESKYDNRTEKTPLPLEEQFTVIVQTSVESKNPREAQVPIFIDDINDRFSNIELNPPKESPTAEVVYENGKLKFTNLAPNTAAVFRVDFLYKVDDNSNSLSRLSRFITIKTPQVPDLDIKSAKITPEITTAEVKFEYYSTPKSNIRSVSVKDSSNKVIKSSWDNTNSILKLEELIGGTKYADVKVSFTLENNKVVEYTLDMFITKPEIVKPTGRIAEFVAKVYKVALGREPEVEGWKFWIRKLESKELPVTQFIYDLMKQDEFINRFLTKEEFIQMMYEIIVGRQPEEEGQKYWEQKYDEYKLQEETLADLRIRIAREMMDTSEFKEYVTSLGLRY